MEITTRKCLYHALFVNEDAAQLASTTFCSVDGAPLFLVTIDTFEIAVTRPKALSKGDDACVFRVERGQRT
jgi:hypothetical protein